MAREGPRRLELTPVAGGASSEGAIYPSLVIAPVLACAPSVVGVTYEAPRGGPLLDFGTEPASQEGVTRLFIGVPLT